MMLTKLDVEFEVFNSNIICKQRIRVKPVEHHYEEEGEPEYIKYGCPICEGLKECYKDRKIDKFSFPKGTPNCPCCGINIEW